MVPSDTSLPADGWGIASLVHSIGTTLLPAPTSADTPDASLHAHEALFRAVFNGAPDAMVVADDGGLCVDINPAACELLGLIRSEVVGCPLPAFGARDATARTLARSVTTSVLPGLHLWVIRDDTSAQDAARERERLTAAVVFERGRLGRLLQNAPAFVAVLRGSDHVHEFVNEAYSALLDAPDLLGRPLSEAIAGVQWAGLIEGVQAALATGETVVGKGVPVVMRRGPEANPETRFVNVMYQAMVAADGTRSGAFLYGVDVTDETVTQRRVRALFKGIPVPTYVWQRVERRCAQEFVLVDFNDAAMILSEGRIARCLGQSAVEYFPPGTGIQDDLDRCLASGETHQREMDHTLRGTVERRRVRVTYASGPPDVVVTHVEDVTEQRKVEEQFRQSQKMEAVGRLAGGVAHDFNNLLSVVLGYTDMILSDLGPDDALREPLGEIQTASERAAGLTRQLLAFSRQQVLEPRVVDLGTVVRGLERMLVRLVGEDIELAIMVSPTAGTCRVDPGQIEQVVMNLVVNARDAMPTGGKLTIEVGDATLDEAYASTHAGARAGRHVVLVVTDTGSGIDLATRTRIFEPFFTTKELGRGTGLGLSTVLGIVQQSEGHVWVYSEPGMGATFKVYLPATEGECISEVVRPSEPGRGWETVLLVEDDDQVRRVAREILERAGYTVLVVDGAAEASSLCATHEGTINLLLTDVVMPKVSGPELARLLVALRPAMKVLYMSGYTDNTVVRHGVLESRMAFLQKPLTTNALLRKVRSVLDAPRASTP